MDFFFFSIIDAEVTKKKMALADDGGGGTAKEGKNAYKLWSIFLVFCGVGVVVVVVVVKLNNKIIPISLYRFITLLHYFF